MDKFCMGNPACGVNVGIPKLKEELAESGFIPPVALVTAEFESATPMVNVFKPALELKEAPTDADNELSVLPALNALELKLADGCNDKPSSLLEFKPRLPHKGLFPLSPELRDKFKD